MTTTTVVLLVVLWAAVLVPGAWRDRRSSPASTVDGFHDAMARLATCDARNVLIPAQGGGWRVHPRPSPRQRMLARRRALLLRLVGLTVATFVTALFGGGLWWAAFATTVLTLGAYVGVLRWLVLRRQEADRVVRRLHPAGRGHTEDARPVAPTPLRPDATDAARADDELVVLDEIDEHELWREGAVVGGRR